MLKNTYIANQKVKWCDLRCGYAEFAKLDALDGDCRTFQSLWCNRLKNHATKNSPCELMIRKRRPAIRK